VNTHKRNGGETPHVLKSRYKLGYMPVGTYTCQDGHKPSLNSIVTEEKTLYSMREIYESDRYDRKIVWKCTATCSTLQTELLLRCREGILIAWTSCVSSIHSLCFYHMGYVVMEETLGGQQQNGFSAMGRGPYKINRTKNQNLRHDLNTSSSWRRARYRPSPATSSAYGHGQRQIHRRMYLRRNILSHSFIRYRIRASFFVCVLHSLSLTVTDVPQLFKSDTSQDFEPDVSNVTLTGSSSSRVRHVGINSMLCDQKVACSNYVGVTNMWEGYRTSIPLPTEGTTWPAWRIPTAVISIF
jgi:hypothetical protein